MNKNEDKETLIDLNNNQVNPKKDFYPNCIVWCPIPCLTWMFPIVGHLGISDSEGIINDFVGSFSINVKIKNISKKWKN